MRAAFKLLSHDELNERARRELMRHHARLQVLLERVVVDLCVPARTSACS